MYLHVGNEVILNEKDVVGVFDTGDIPKSLVVWERNGERKLFLSQLAPATLRKRQRRGIGV